MRLPLLSLVTLLIACGSPETTPASPEQPTSPSTAAEEGETTPEAPPLPEVESGEVFDFWRVVLEPGRHEGRERVCVTSRVDAVSDRARHLPPNRREEPNALLLGCERGSERFRHDSAPLTLIVPEGQDHTAVVRSERSPTAFDVEVRVRVRILGLAPDLQTPVAELLGVERVRQEGEDDPTPRPPRCRREEIPVREQPTVEASFDFRQWREHLGTRQVCAVQYLNAPRRVGARPGERPVPDGVDVLMDVGCRGENGLSRVRLLFGEAATRGAPYVGVGSRVTGIVGERGDLRVGGVRQPAAPPSTRCHRTGRNGPSMMNALSMDAPTMMDAPTQ